MRSDARRNHDRLLEVAKESFAAAGPDASLDDIAKKAGVGSGTLYRHFPTRQSLQEAVFREEVERICRQAHVLAEEAPADEAIFTWLRQFVKHTIGRRGLAMALKSTLDLESELFSYCHREIRTAAGRMLELGQGAGSVRADLEVSDVLRLASGVALSCEHSEHPLADSERLMSFVFDAMRPRS